MDCGYSKSFYDRYCETYLNDDKADEKAEDKEDESVNDQEIDQDDQIDDTILKKLCSICFKKKMGDDEDRERYTYEDELEDIPQKVESPSRLSIIFSFIYS